MTKERKAGITVSLLFIGPLVLCAWILIASWDQHPSTPAEQAAIAAELQSARNAQEAVQLPPGPERDGYSDWQDQKRDEQQARAQEEYRADQHLDERIRDAANAAANTAVKQAMSEKPGY